MKTIKAGTTEISEAEVKEMISFKTYVCNYSGIWQPHYSEAQNQYYFTKVISYKGYARRGRFYIQNAETINHILDKKVLNEN